MGLIATYLPRLLLRDIAGGLKIHEEAWSLITDEVQRLYLGPKPWLACTTASPAP